jgi:hypothetical protein
VAIWAAASHVSPRVPELTPRADIKLNQRVSLRELIEIDNNKRMSWLLKYFEAGSIVPHTIEKLHSREAVEQSVLIFLRLGGDDDLQITDSGAPNPDPKPPRQA